MPRGAGVSCTATRSGSMPATFPVRSRGTVNVEQVNPTASGHGFAVRAGAAAAPTASRQAAAAMHTTRVAGRLPTLASTRGNSILLTSPAPGVAGTVRRMKTRSRRRRLVLVAALFLVEPVLMKLRGYPIGGRLIVRCRQGHLFTTIWIPSVSVKAFRLGWLRFQRCPVGGHWSIVVPVRTSELGDDERQLARQRHD